MALNFSELRYNTITPFARDKYHQNQGSGFLSATLSNEAFPVIMLTLRLPDVTFTEAHRADPQALEIGYREDRASRNGRCGLG